MSGQQSNKALLASFQARADASERAMSNLATQFTALTSGQRDFDTDNEVLLKLREKNEKLKYQLEFLKKRTAAEIASGPVCTAQKTNTTTTAKTASATTTTATATATASKPSNTNTAPATAPTTVTAVVETITATGNVNRGFSTVARNAPPQEPKKDIEQLKLLGRSEVDALKRLAFVMSDAAEASKLLAKGGPFATRPDNFIALRKSDHPLIIASKEKNWIIYIDVLRAFEAGVAFYQGEDCYLTRGQGDTHFFPSGCVSMNTPSGSTGTTAAAAVSATAASPSSEPAPSDGDRPRTASWSKWIGTAAAGTAIAALAWKKFF